MLSHYWYFKDVGFEFEPHVCNECHNLLVTAYELKNITILNLKNVDFRCILWGISRDEAVNRRNNSVLEDKICNDRFYIPLIYQFYQDQFHQNLLQKRYFLNGFWHKQNVY